MGFKRYGIAVVSAFHRLNNGGFAFIEILVSRLLVLVRPPRNTQIPQHPRSILIFGYMGLGDAILFLPALRELRHAYPDAELSVVYSPVTAAHQVFQYTGIFQHQYFLNFKTTSLAKRWALLQTLRRQNFDIVISTQISPIEHFTPVLWQIPTHIGHIIASHKVWKPRPNWLINYPVALERGDTNLESEKYFRLIRTVVPGGEFHYRSQDLTFYKPTPRRPDYIPNNATIVGFHAVVNPTQHWKHWGDERYAELVIRLLENCPHVYILFFGETSDRQKIENLILTITSHTPNFAPRLHAAIPSEAPDLPEPLVQTMTLLQSCSVLVSHDGGIAHVAASLLVPVVRLFEMTDYHAYRSPEPQHQDIWKALPCSPCFSLGSLVPGKNLTNCGRRLCLECITVDEVYEAVVRRLPSTAVEDKGVFMIQKS